MLDARPVAKMLPDKLTLEMAASELGLGHLSHNSQLFAIIQYQRDHGLIIKTNSPIDCMAQYASDDVYESSDEDGMRSYQASEYTFEVHTTGETITLGPLHIVTSTKLGFRQFSIDGTELYLVDEDSCELSGGAYEITALYIEREDLARFLADGVEGLPAYADPATDFYAPELVLAFQLHQALRVRNEINQNLNMEARVHMWLKKNNASSVVSDAQVRRLATIIGDGKKLPKGNKKDKS